jgi:hypothetical protein
MVNLLGGNLKEFCMPSTSISQTKHLENVDSGRIESVEQAEQLSSSNSAHQSAFPPVPSEADVHRYLNQFTAFLSPRGSKCSDSKHVRGHDTFVDDGSTIITVASSTHQELFASAQITAQVPMAMNDVESSSIQDDDLEELEFQLKIHFQIRRLNATLQSNTNLAMSKGF